jgi:tetratricopeptide (TPR) repeat protein
VDTEQIAYAQSLFNESLALYRELGEPAGIGKALWGLGLALVSAKDWQAARRVFEESLQIFRDLDDRFHLGWALHEVGSVSVRLGELAKARAMLEEGIKIFADARDISGVVLLLDDMSDLAAAEGRHLTAIRLAAAAAKLQAVTGTNLADRSNEISGRVRPGANLADEEAAAWAEGQAMDADQAVACALSRSESAHQVVG